MQDYSLPSGSGRDAGATGNVVLNNGTAANDTVANTTPPPAAFDPHGLSSRDWAIGVGVMVVLSVVFFLVRGFVTSMLVDRRAAPDAARGAGWALFLFLFTTAACLVFGLLGDYWGKFLFAAPSGALILATGLLALVMNLRAGSVRR